MYSSTCINSIEKNTKHKDDVMITSHLENLLGYQLCRITGSADKEANKLHGEVTGETSDARDLAVLGIATERGRGLLYRPFQTLGGGRE